MSISIEGLLSWRKKISFMQNDDGTRMSDKEARLYLKKCLAEGKRVLPTSDKCDGFDYIKGCPGHEIK